MKHERSMQEILEEIRRTCADEEAADAEREREPASRTGAPSAEVVDINRARPGR
jgi:hypothetical protein